MRLCRTLAASARAAALALLFAGAGCGGGGLRGLEGGGLFGSARCQPLRIAGVRATPIPIASPPAPPPCPEPPALRARLEALVAQGRLDRALRLFARESERCPDAARPSRELAEAARQDLAALGADPDALLGRCLAAHARGESAPARASCDAALLSLERQGGAPVVEEGSADTERRPTSSGGYHYTWDEEEKHQEIVKLLRFSVDGERLLVAGRNRWTASFSLRTGALERALRAPEQASLWALAASPDGMRVAQREGASLTLYDLAGGPARKLGGHEKNSDYSEELDAAAFFWDGRRVATGDEKGTLRVFRVADGKLLAETFALRDRLQALAASPDGRFLASAFRSESAVRIRGASDGGAVYAILPTESDDLDHLAWSAGGRHLLAAGLFEEITVWDLSTCRAVTITDKYPCHRYEDGSCGGLALFGVALAPAGDRVIGAFDDDGLIVWDGQTGKHLAALPRRPPDRVLEVAFSADGSLVAAGTEAGAWLFRAGHGAPGQPELAPLVHLALDARAGGAAGVALDLHGSPASAWPVPTGYYDVFGAGDDRLTCRVGERRLPLFVCEDRLRVRGLLARRARGLPVDPLDDDRR